MTGLRHRRLGVLLALMVLLATACATEENDPSATGQGEDVVVVDKPELVVAAGKDNSRTTPAFRANVATGFGNANAPVCETLAALGEDFTAQPLLADRWELNPPSTWRLHLHAGVTFHNGAPFDAEAVAANVRRWAEDPNNRLSVGPESAVVVDAATVDVTPIKTNLHLVEQLTHPLNCMLAPGTFAGEGTAPENTPTGTGPFRFESYQKAEQLRVVRHDGYWGAKPKTQRITFRFVPDDATRVLALREGEVDAIYDFPREQASSYADDPDIVTVKSAPGGYAALLLNLRGTAPYDILNDLSVRQAVASAIDRTAIVDNVWQGNAEETSALIPEAILGANAATVKGYPYEPAEAERLLDAAGWVPGSDGIRAKDGRRLELTLVVVDVALLNPAPVLIQSQLKEVGIDVDSATSLRGRTVRPQLLGLVVRAVQGRGAAARRRRPSGGPGRDVDLRGHRRRGLPRRRPRLRRALRDHLSERLRRQGLAGRPLRRHRLPGDVLRRPAGPRPAPDRRPGLVARGGRGRDPAGAPGLVRALAIGLLALVLAGAAAANEARPTASELESELVCPVCETTLDTSDAPIARRMKAYIRERIAAGDTKSEIKAQLVEQFGPTRARGAAEARLRSRRLDPAARGHRARGARRRRADRLALEPRAWRRRAVADEPLDPDARTSPRRRARPLRVSEQRLGPLAFGAGFVSFLAPCVLPLVPGYLSAVSSVEAERLGEPGAAAPRRALEPALRRRPRRRLRPARRGRRGDRPLDRAEPVPAGADRRPRPDRLRLRLHGPAAMAAAPRRRRASSRERAAAGRASCSAARSRSARRLASARCSARSSCSPATRRRVWEGSALLAVYALGLAVPFLIAAAVFAPAMGLFRRVRDHYTVIQFVSGLVLVALGGLLFSGQFWRLRVYLNRLFELF